MATNSLSLIHQEVSSVCLLLESRFLCDLLWSILEMMLYNFLRIGLKISVISIVALPLCLRAFWYLVQEAPRYDDQPHRWRLRLYGQQPWPCSQHKCQVALNAHDGNNLPRLNRWWSPEHSGGLLTMQPQLASHREEELPSRAQWTQRIMRKNKLYLSPLAIMLQWLIPQL